MAVTTFNQVKSPSKVVLFMGTEKENHCIWSDIRVDRNSLPDGWFAYDIRGNDDDGWAYCIENNYVWVNHVATILTQKPIEFENNCPIILDEIDWSFE